MSKCIYCLKCQFGSECLKNVNLGQSVWFVRCCWRHPYWPGINKMKWRTNLKVRSIWPALTTFLLYLPVAAWGNATGNFWEHIYTWASLGFLNRFQLLSSLCTASPQCYSFIGNLYWPDISSQLPPPTPVTGATFLNSWLKSASLFLLRWLCQ